MNERGVVRWGRVIASGLIAMIAVLVVGAAAVLSFTSLSSYEAGHLVGTIAFPALIAGGAVSYLGQRGTSAAIRVLAFVGIVAGVAAIANLPKLVDEHGAQLEQTDRVPLVDDGGRLAHPTLGFSIEKPPGFAPAPQLATMLQSGPSIYAYAYADQPMTAALAISVGPLADASPQVLTKEMHEYRDGMADAAKGRGSAFKVDVLQDEVSGAADHLVGHINFVIAGGAHVQSTFYPIARRGGWLCVIVMIIGRDANALPGVLDSFRAE